MLEGTIIENSLNDTSILKNLTVTKTWVEDDWILHQVNVTKEEALKLGAYLAEGPWYIHFWERDKDDVLVVYNNAAFAIKYSDKDTWQEALQHGRGKGIPQEQLDFAIK